jgi:hypothetical protein
MLNELFQKLDGRQWLTIADNRDESGRRVIELAPSGLEGIRPKELVVVTFTTTEGPIDLPSYAKAHIAALKDFCVDGQFSAVSISENSRQIGYSISLAGDALSGDMFVMCRVIKDRTFPVVVIYEIHDRISETEKSLWRRRISALPKESVSDARADPFCVRPISSLPILPNIRSRLDWLANTHPKYAERLRAAIADLPVKLGLQHFGCLMSVLRSLVSINQRLEFFVPECGDELSAAAEFTTQFFRNNDISGIYHFALSVFARILIDDERLDLERIDRGLRISRRLLDSADRAQSGRLEEAALSYLIGANRTAIIAETHDPIERSTLACKAMGTQPLPGARVLARLALKRTAKHRKSGDRLLEELYKTDVISYVLDSMTVGPDSDSIVPAITRDFKTVEKDQHGFTHGSFSMSDIHRALEECPPELTLQGSPDEAAQGTGAGLWTEDRAPLFALRMRAEALSADAQSKLYGIHYERYREVAQEFITIRRKQEPFSALFLRSFRSTRRMWVNNAFQPGNPDVLPYPAEPSKMTLESAVDRGLGLHFDCATFGGMSDPFGVIRIFAPRTTDDSDFWKEDLTRCLGTSHCILLLPDGTPSIRWEIEEICRCGVIHLTTLIMLPESVDRAAGHCWREVIDLLSKAVLELPAYQPAGAFVSLNHDGGFEELPFAALFTGQLATFLRSRIAK